jgi:signal transduction histidine kinase
MGIAILKYRLYDIDLIINRTLVYGGLTAAIVGVYVLVVATLGALLPVRDNLFLSLLVAGLLAVLFNPLRERLQRAANRLMFGQRDDPYAVLSRLGQRLAGSAAPEAILHTVAETVAVALRLPYAAIRLTRNGVDQLSAEYGSPAPGELALPLVHQSEAVGHLVVAPRAPGEPLTAKDRRLLEDIAHQAGAVAQAVRLTHDLQRSRERLVRAREEERRRLRRDLHDGLAPTLAALALTASTASDLVPDDPSAAVSLLAELQGEIRAAVADIRRLVYDLRPPALDELGLAAAIRQHAAQIDHPRPARPGAANGLQVIVEGPTHLPALPAAVEVAAYRITQEALTNVVRHAQARTCQVRLALDDGLHLEITDDGVGLPEQRRAGVGLLSMRERAAELGGSCVIERRNGAGTRVYARLPASVAEA